MAGKDERKLAVLSFDLPSPRLYGPRAARSRRRNGLERLDLSDIFDEVDEELRAERARKLFRRYGGLMVAGAVLVVAAAGGWEAWKYRRDQERMRIAGLYLAAARIADAPSGGDRAAARADFATIAAEAGAGYRTLARLRAAALAADAGQGAEALGLWDSIAADSAADPLLRDVARLHWAGHEIDKGDAGQVEAHLQPLTAPGNPLRPLAEEAQALLDLRLGKTDTARDTLRRLSQDVTAPEGVRGRANGLLAQIGS